jgi:hypothetical protein
MKKITIIALFAIAAITTFGFVTINNNSSDEQTANQTELSTSNEKSGITETGSW